MAGVPAYEAPKWLLVVLNSLYEAEWKLDTHGDPSNVLRNLHRIRDKFREEQFFYESPMGQPFSETRADLEATISGDRTENLVVVEVIKPIIRHGQTAVSRVVQRGIVVVRSRDEGDIG